MCTMHIQNAYTHQFVQWSKDGEEKEEEEKYDLNMSEHDFLYSSSGIPRSLLFVLGGHNKHAVAHRLNSACLSSSITFSCLFGDINQINPSEWNTGTCIHNLLMNSPSILSEEFRQWRYFRNNITFKYSTTFYVSDYDTLEAETNNMIQNDFNKLMQDVDTWIKNTSEINRIMHINQDFRKLNIPQIAQTIYDCIYTQANGMFKGHALVHVFTPMIYPFDYITPSIKQITNSQYVYKEFELFIYGLIQFAEHPELYNDTDIIKFPILKEPKLKQYLPWLFSILLLKSGLSTR